MSNQPSEYEWYGPGATVDYAQGWDAGYSAWPAGDPPPTPAEGKPLTIQQLGYQDGYAYRRHLAESRAREVDRQRGRA
jgi:hypothetical protein